MNLSQQIKDIVNTLYPNSEFTLSTKFKANIHSFALEQTKLPFIILDNELTKSGMINKNATLNETVTILLTILSLDSHYNDDNDSNNIIEITDEMARRIAVNIYQLDNIYVPAKSTQNYTLTPSYRIFNTELSGTILGMNVIDQRITNFCKI